MSTATQQRIALSEGIAGFRAMLIAATCLSVLGALTIVIFSTLTPMVDGIDAFIALALVASYSVCIFLYLKLPKRHMHALLFVWATLTFVSSAAFFANALFGGAYGISNGAMAFMCPYIPVAIIFFHAYLIPRAAWLFTAAFVVVCGGMTMFYLMRYDASPQAYWMLVCLTIVPIHSALLSMLNIRNQGAVVAAMQEEKLALEQRVATQRRQVDLDPLTGALNGPALLKRLRADIRNGLQPNVAIIQAHNHPELRKQLSDSANLRLTQQIAARVRRHIGPDAPLGRQNETQFVTWADAMDVTSLGENLAALNITSRGEMHFDMGYALYPPPTEQRGGLDVAFDLMLEAENDLFIKSLKNA